MTGSFGSRVLRRSLKRRACVRCGKRIKKGAEYWDVGMKFGNEWVREHVCQVCYAGEVREPKVNMDCGRECGVCGGGIGVGEQYARVKRYLKKKGRVESYGVCFGCNKVPFKVGGLFYWETWLMVRVGDGRVVWVLQERDDGWVTKEKVYGFQELRMPFEGETFQGRRSAAPLVMGRVRG